MVKNAIFVIQETYTPTDGRYLGDERVELRIDLGWFSDHTVAQVTAKKLNQQYRDRFKQEYASYCAGVAAMAVKVEEHNRAGEAEVQILRTAGVQKPDFVPLIEPIKQSFDNWLKAVSTEMYHAEVVELQRSEMDKAAARGGRYSNV